MRIVKTYSIIARPSKLIIINKECEYDIYSINSNDMWGGMIKNDRMLIGSLPYEESINLFTHDFPNTPYKIIKWNNIFKVSVPLSLFKIINENSQDT